MTRCKVDLLPVRQERTVKCKRGVGKPSQKSLQRGKREKRTGKAEHDSSTTAKRYRTVEGSSERGDRGGGNGRETTAIGGGTSKNERQEDSRAKQVWETWNDSGDLTATAERSGTLGVKPSYYS